MTQSVELEEVATSLVHMEEGASLNKIKFLLGRENEQTQLGGDDQEHL